MPLEAEMSPGSTLASGSDDEVSTPESLTLGEFVEELVTVAVDELDEEPVLDDGQDEDVDVDVGTPSALTIAARGRIGGSKVDVLVDDDEVLVSVTVEVLADDDEVLVSVTVEVLADDDELLVAVDVLVDVLCELQGSEPSASPPSMAAWALAPRPTSTAPASSRVTATRRVAQRISRILPTSPK